MRTCHKCGRLYPDTVMVCLYCYDGNLQARQPEPAAPAQPAVEPEGLAVGVRVRFHIGGDESALDEGRVEQIGINPLRQRVAHIVETSTGRPTWVLTTRIVATCA